MSKKHIIRIDGKTVEVSDEIYTFLKRSEWNNNYAEPVSYTHLTLPTT